MVSKTTRAWVIYQPEATIEERDIPLIDSMESLMALIEDERPENDGELYHDDYVAIYAAYLPTGLEARKPGLGDNACQRVDSLWLWQNLGLERVMVMYKGYRPEFLADDQIMVVRFGPLRLAIEAGDHHGNYGNRY